MRGGRSTLQASRGYNQIQSTVRSAQQQKRCHVDDQVHEGYDSVFELSYWEGGVDGDTRFQMVHMKRSNPIE